MVMDMDIDMDIDIALDETPAQGELLPAPPSTSATVASNDFIDAEAQQLAPSKVNLEGLDDFTTNDIRVFAMHHFQGEIKRIEWIDDHKANIVYKDDATARQALLALSASKSTEHVPTQTLTAKAIPSHPQTTLRIRMAVAGDRKQAGARERSRFYLFHPAHEGSERGRRSKGRKGGTQYRDRREDDYRTNRYDNREQRKRQVRDEQSAFDASLYDDDEASLALRAFKKQERSGSLGSENASHGFRHRDIPRKELFPGRLGQQRTQNGRLRERSSSPRRDSDNDRDDRPSRDNAATANRLKAQTLKAQLRKTNQVKELFPAKGVVNHRRSAAVDETADLFSHKMPSVPFLDGSSEPRMISDRTSISTAVGRSLTDDVSPNLNIRGAADLPKTQMFSIKGAALSVQEIFPAYTGTNTGKELFTDKLEGRQGRRRNRAEDLFA